MITKSIILIPILFILVFATKDCQIGLPNKCLGYTKRFLGRPINLELHLIRKTILENFKECIYKCINSSECRMSSYRLSKQSCYLFSRMTKLDNTYNDYRTFKWYCCDTSKGYDPQSRCPGFWSYKIYNSIQNNYHNSYPIVKSKFLNKNRCQMACLNNPVCGAINVIVSYNIKPGDFICELILNFPTKNLIYKPDAKRIFYKWTCIDGYQTPIFFNTKCINRPGFKYKGRWIEKSRNVTYNENLGISLISFYTFDLKNCLDACTEMFNCIFPIFGNQIGRCILMGRNDSHCSYKINDENTTFIIYKWHSCNVISNQTTISNHIKRKCGKIHDNTHIMISHDKCGHQPCSISLHHKCKTSLLQNTKYNIIDNCQNNQSFQILNQVNKTTVQIFTGYDNFWLFNVSEHNFPVIISDYCRYYDANFDSYKDFKSLNIIKRSEWFAMPSKHPLKKFHSIPLPFIIISDTNTQSCNCYTHLSCAHAIRAIQTRDLIDASDIKYNFIVTGNGDIYEGVGMEYNAGAASIDYNSKSIIIGLYGNNNQLINLSVQKSTKMLINYLLNSGIVSNNYSLFMLTDISNHFNQFENNHKINSLHKNIISLWPRYKGYVRVNCYPFKDGIITNNIGAILISISLICIILLYQFDLLIGKEIKLTNYGQFQFNAINGKSETSNELVSPYFTKIYIIANKQPLGYFRRKCNCKAALFCLLDKARFQSKFIKLKDIINLTEIQNCSSCEEDEFNGIIFFNDYDVGIVNFLYLHNIPDFKKENILEVVENKCQIPKTLSVEQYSSQTKILHTFYKCNPDKMSEQLIVRSKLESEFCKYFYEDGDPIQYSSDFSQ